MNNIPVAREIKENVVSSCMWGVLIILLLVAVVVISLHCCGLLIPNGPNKESFAPMVYKKNIMSVPGNCKPYMGCYYPSSLSNPVSLDTATRMSEFGEDDVNKNYCKKSWRDCNAYQDCVDGQCRFKSYNVES
jgi:hypothetical protein